MLLEAILAFTDDTGYDTDRATDLIPGKRKCTREARLLPHPYSRRGQEGPGHRQPTGGRHAQRRPKALKGGLPGGRGASGYGFCSLSPLTCRDTLAPGLGRGGGGSFLTMGGH